MKKFVGAFLVVLGVMGLAGFSVWGTTRAGASATQYHSFLPILALGLDFPHDTLKLCVAIGFLILGLYYGLGETGPSPLAQVFLLNALLLCSALIFALGASHNPQYAGITGVFAAAALLQALVGLVLLFFAVSERPVGAVGLTLGGVLYVSSAAIGAVIYLSGKA